MTAMALGLSLKLNLLMLKVNIGFGMKPLLLGSNTTFRRSDGINDC